MGLRNEILHYWLSDRLHHVGEVACEEHDALDHGPRPSLLTVLLLKI